MFEIELIITVLFCHLGSWVSNNCWFGVRLVKAESMSA